jgi:hypothetical protein
MWARRAATGAGVELVLEVLKEQTAAETRAAPIGFISAKEIREAGLRTTVGVTQYAKAPPSGGTEGGTRGPPTIPGESLREQRMRLQAHGPYSPPAPSELPLGASGRFVRGEREPERENYVHVLIPEASFQALRLFRRGGLWAIHPGLEAPKTTRSRQDLIRAAAYALYTARTSAFAGGFAAVPRKGYVQTRALYRGAVTQEAFAPGTFPPGYAFTYPPTGGKLVPTTTDTVAALLYLEGLWYEQPPETGEPPGRGYISNVLRDYHAPDRYGNPVPPRARFAWTEESHIAGTSINVLVPPVGPAPKD